MESKKDYVILRKTIITLSTSFILAYLLAITGLVLQLTDEEECRIIPETTWQGGSFCIFFI